MTKKFWISTSTVAAATIVMAAPLTALAASSGQAGTSTTGSTYSSTSPSQMTSQAEKKVEWTDLTSAVAYMNKTQMSALPDWTLMVNFADNHIVPNVKWSAKGLSSKASTGTLDKEILAALADHLNPHDLMGHNLVQDLASREWTSGKNAGYFASAAGESDTTDTGLSVTDQALSILALQDAGGVKYDAAAAEKWLLGTQHKDGGFGYQVGASSDSNDTAYVIEALASLGDTSMSGPVAKALAYEKKLQVSDGGFLYDSTAKAMDADSDGTVMDALASVGIAPSSWAVGTNTPVTALLSLYNAKVGGFNYQLSGKYSGVDGYSTRDGAFGLAASLTGKSIFERLHYTPLTKWNAYWAAVAKKHGLWMNHQWMPWSAVKDEAAAGSYDSSLNAYWQAVVKKGGMWVTKDGHPVFMPWNEQMAHAALVGSFGADSVFVAGL